MRFAKHNRLTQYDSMNVLSLACWNASFIDLILCFREPWWPHNYYYYTVMLPLSIVGAAAVAVHLLIVMRPDEVEHLEPEPLLPPWRSSQKQLLVASPEPSQEPATPTASPTSTARRQQPPTAGDYELQRRHPQATTAECRRFLMAQNHSMDEASAQLQTYLDWRAQYCNDDDDDESNNNKTIMNSDNSAVDDDDNNNNNTTDGDWDRAARIALMSSQSNSSSTPTNISLPCIIFGPESSNTTNDTTYLTALDGTPIVQHLPARIDLTLADGPTYGLALCLYLDAVVLDRHSFQKLTVLIDTRPGTGWANIPARQLVPFCRTLAQQLNDLFPERLARCILFPVPRVAQFVWQVLVKPFVDAETAAKVCLVAGRVQRQAPPPRSLSRYVDADTVACLEQRRRACMTTTTPPSSSS